MIMSGRVCFVLDAVLRLILSTDALESVYVMFMSSSSVTACSTEFISSC